jgi:hypothetical protein
MTLQLIPSLIVDPDAVIRKERELPCTGEVLCKVGDIIDSESIVARTQLAGDLVILKIAERLGIEVFEVKKGLKVSIGEEVQEGQLLCEHSGIFGLFRSRYRSPGSGTIEFFSETTGHLGLRLPARQLEVNAYLSGEVIAVNECKSVTIESKAVLVQGIFGIGGERLGELLLVKPDLSSDVCVSDLPENLSGKIVVYPGNVDADILSEAARRGACGFILGSIEDRSLSSYLGYEIGIALTGDEKISMSVVITEGFGHLRMAERTWSILSALNGCRAAMNGTTQVQAGAVRPEIIVFSKMEEQEILEKGELDRQFCQGAKIRIIRAPYFGVIATIKGIPEKLERIETGAYTRVLQVCLPDGNEVTVPRANVELL